MFPRKPFRSVDLMVVMILCLYCFRKGFLVLQMDVRNSVATISVISTVDLLLMVTSIGIFSPGTNPDFGTFPEIFTKFFL